MDSSSIQIVKHKDKALLDNLRRMIDENFHEDESFYNAMDTDSYRAFALDVQNKINEMEIAQKICEGIFDELTAYLGTDHFMIQSNVYLRCARPQNPSKQENIGFHRESFYGENMETSVNIWTPIRGVVPENSLQYIPESQNIPEEDIITTSEEDQYTKQFSAGHKLGFLYKPKDIVSGVDLTKKKSMAVPYYASSIFSGSLVHGAAENYTDNIRFSCDFRIIRKRDYSNQNKQFHLASGKPYFIDFAA